MKHTQGPWTIGYEKVQIVEGVEIYTADITPVLPEDQLYRGAIASIHSTGGVIPNGITMNEARANGLLLRSAPDLLEALEYAMPYLEACVPNPRNGANGDINCVARARAAINKAKGIEQ